MHGKTLKLVATHIFFGQDIELNVCGLLQTGSATSARFDRHVLTDLWKLLE